MKYNRIHHPHSKGDIPEPRAASGGAPVEIRSLCFLKFSHHTTSRKDESGVELSARNKARTNSRFWKNIALLRIIQFSLQIQ